MFVITLSDIIQFCQLFLVETYPSKFETKTGRPTQDTTSQFYVFVLYLVITSNDFLPRERGYATVCRLSVCDVQVP